MSSTLDDIIAKAKALARRNETDEAMRLATELTGQYPKEMEAWLLQGYLHELEDDYPKAVADLTRAMELNPSEPHLYYSRGRYLFQLHEDDPAVRDFNKGLAMCDFNNNDYYREELHFWRAEALLRLGAKEEALKDLSQVPDDFRSWTYALRTKQDLLRDCGVSVSSTCGNAVISAGTSPRR